MKTIKVLGLLTSLLTATLALADNKVQESAYRKGYAAVTIETQVQGKNGSTEIKIEKLCDMEINVPVYKITGENMEIEMAKNIRKCAVKIGNVQANVWISPMIIDWNMSSLDTFKNANYANAPKWIKDSYIKSNGKLTAYLNTIYLFPKDYDLHKDQNTESTELMKQISELYEMLGDTAPTQAAAVLDKTKPTILLSTSTDPSLKYCAIHYTDSYCSLRYRIKSEVTFKGE